jgi:penicillin amidase
MVMKTFKNILLALLLLFILLFVGGSVMIRHISHRSVPDYNESISIKGLNNPVDVFRDEFGVPHVYAQSEEDLYRVVGYLMAQDRLWQMDLVRRISTGRLSEILGPMAIETDKLFRALRIPEKSEILIAKTDPEIFRQIEAFTDGVNQYIDANQKRLPFEFTVLGYKPEHWEVIHSYNLVGYMSWMLKKGWSSEPLLLKIRKVVDDEKFNELFPDLSIQQQAYPGFLLSSIPEFKFDFQAADKMINDLGVQVFSGSNNWAVSGTRTESGFPIVANDMHLKVDIAPGIWYQIHQVVPGKLNVTGVMLSGAPFVICGHNDSIAWGMTNVAVDNVDFYIETINPADSNQYWFNGSWKDMKVVKEKIIVKGGDTVTFFNRFTHRGPVASGFHGVKDKVISARWIGNEFSNELRTVYLLNRANNWQEFTNALSTFISTSQNLVYGDKAGNIGLYCAAGVPIREGNPALIMPGDTSLYDWKGLVPFEKLPHLFNPPEGFVASANNKSVGTDYPYFISNWYDLPSRYIRIVEMINKTGKHNTETFRQIQTDQHSKWAQKVLLAVLPLVDDNSEIINRNSVFQSLKSWDYNFTPESAEASLFEVFNLEMKKAIFRDELGEDLYNEFLNDDKFAQYGLDKLVSGEKYGWCDNITTPDVTEDFADIIEVSFISAFKDLDSLLGPDPMNWKWGRLHQISFNHPLASVNILKKIFKLEKGPYAVGGTNSTVCASYYEFRNPFVTTWGASERHIFDCSDWDKSLTVIPTGESGIPASDFYCNQTDMYINKEYHADPFTRESVEKHAKYHAVFNNTESRH